MPDRPHYYHHHDLPRFGEIERGARELAEAGEIVVVVVMRAIGRSEEHTSELQSLAYLVCRLLLEKHPIRSEEHTSELQSLAYLVCRLLLETKEIRPFQHSCVPQLRHHLVCRHLTPALDVLRTDVR